MAYTIYGRNAMKGIACFVGLLLAMTLVACTRSPEDAPDAGKSALIIVDMQYDFMPGGSLPTSGGDELTGLINRLQPGFDLVVATQDWHPQNHGSFASNQPGHQPGDVIEFNGLEQVLWPDHGVQGTHGAKIAADLDQDRIARVFQKGTNPDVDSYSGFFDNGQRGDTGLNDYLWSEGVTDVYVVGLALDYCVKYTALDARRMGFDTTLIVDASRPVNLKPTDGAEAVETMKAAGVRVMEAESFLELVQQ